MKLTYFLLALQLTASPLRVGPINVIGTGSIFLDSSVHEYWMGIRFSGSDDTGDTVTVNGMSPNCTFTLDGLTFGNYFGFGIYTYTGSINGIQGYALFTNIGSDYGLLQIYQPDPNRIYGQGPLLAESQITTRTRVTNSVNFPGGFGHSQEDFELYTPTPIPTSNTVPEVPTFTLGLLGLATFLIYTRKGVYGT